MPKHKYMPWGGHLDKSVKKRTRKKNVDWLIFLNNRIKFWDCRQAFASFKHGFFQVCLKLAKACLQSQNLILLLRKINQSTFRQTEWEVSMLRKKKILIQITVHSRTQWHLHPVTGLLLLCDGGTYSVPARNQHCCHCYMSQVTICPSHPSVFWWPPSQNTEGPQTTMPITWRPCSYKHLLSCNITHWAKGLFCKC